MSVSACILSFNRPQYIYSAVLSVLEQTVKPAEIIVFDNGSSHNVYNSIEPLLELGVVWVGADSTGSAIWNFQRAVNTASSDFVFVLHDDDRLCQDYIEKQLSFISSKPSVVAVSCNGYRIDSNDQRTGELVLSISRHSCVEYFRSPADVAMRYASDKCLPFSPTLYRRRFIVGQHLRADIGKVVDAVLFCELAKTGLLAYLPYPLYESRIHSGQDSSFFPDEVIDRLENYFLSEISGSQAQLNRLKSLIERQHTRRKLMKAFHITLSRETWLGCNYRFLLALVGSKISIRAAVIICFISIGKRVKRIFSLGVLLRDRSRPEHILRRVK